MQVDAKVFGQLAECILDQGARKATKYISPKLTVKACRKLFRGKMDKRSKITEIIFTVGTPNFEERKFIKDCKKAGIPLPVTKIQIKLIKR
jgi:hypothetical protein